MSLVGNGRYFVSNLKSTCISEILNTAHLIPFSTTQYPFSYLYLPTQIQMDIVCQKTGFKREFVREKN